MRQVTVPARRRGPRRATAGPHGFPYDESAPRPFAPRAEVFGGVIGAVPGLRGVPLSRVPGDRLPVLETVRHAMIPGLIICPAGLWPPTLACIRTGRSPLMFEGDSVWAG